jgi:sugar lactone lactonase YvrE
MGSAWSVRASGSVRNIGWTAAILFLAAALLWGVGLLGQGEALARPDLDRHSGTAATTELTAEGSSPGIRGWEVLSDVHHQNSVAPASVLGTVLPRIQCALGYTATVYVTGLASPDGLAFSPDGVLYVAEESGGRVSRVGAGGTITPVLTGLREPEGITFDDAGNLYVVEDIGAGRLIKRTPEGVITTLAVDLEAPEGVACGPDDLLYVSESNLQFETNPLEVHSRIAAVSSSGVVSRIITSTPMIVDTNVTFWSYAGLVFGSDGLLYVANELSGREGSLGSFTLFTMDSVFTVDPVSGSRALFASGLVVPEGLRFSTGGRFPLYVAEEDIGGGAGRLSRIASDGSHLTMCTGFLSIEDVAMFQGALYVSEDGSGLIIQIKPTRQVWLSIVLR